MILLRNWTGLITCSTPVALKMFFQSMFLSQQLFGACRFENGFMCAMMGLIVLTYWIFSYNKSVFQKYNWAAPSGASACRPYDILRWPIGSQVVFLIYTSIVHFIFDIWKLQFRIHSFGKKFDINLNTQ